MGDAAHEIRVAWQSLAGTEHDEVVTEVLQRHAEPHRRYHTAEHVMWVLRHVHRLLAESAGTDIDANAVIAAALFHDAIYDPRSGSNEAESAELAASRVRRLGWADARIDEVKTLINATAGHSPTTPAEAVLLDADLAVLGSEPDAYALYVAGVRFEYRHVADDQWRIGRAAVLHSFLDRSRIYATDTMRTEREAAARRNLATELATVTGS